jgi:putative permease
MKSALKDWFDQYFSDPELLILVVFLGLGLTVLTTMGEMIAPVLLSIVITYFLGGLVDRLKKWGFPSGLAVWFVYLLFFSLMFLALFGLFPLLFRQLSNLLQDLPQILATGQAFLLELPKKYPEYVSVDQMNNLVVLLKTNTSGLGKWAFSLSISSITTFIMIVIYLILVPLLVFFFLKDSKRLLSWSGKFLPQKNQLIFQVWEHVQLQLGNYIRGKAIEIAIVSAVTFAVFMMMGLPYAVLLSVGVGLSVLIPYVGAVLITVPVVVVALMTWGLQTDFINLMIAYVVIITLDGNLLVPILFSETMNLHPVAIIVSVLVFGGIWGFWGIFFSIPLTTLVKAVLDLIEKNISKNALGEKV